MNTVVSLLSLVIAALAVFVGPMINRNTAQRQLMASLEIANKQIIAPLREAWISSLRELLAELASSALHYYVAGFEERTDQEYKHLTLLQTRVSLMLNPLEDDHKELERCIRKMVGAINDHPSADVFPKMHDKVIDLSRRILKREWNRVKAPITPG